MSCNGQLFAVMFLSMRIAVHANNWQGYGLTCHRALRACSELMGIKDLYCKVEANTKNYQAIVRAFFDALVHQVTDFCLIWHSKCCAFID